MVNMLGFLSVHTIVDFYYQMLLNLSGQQQAAVATLIQLTIIRLAEQCFEHCPAEQR